MKAVPITRVVPDEHEADKRPLSLQLLRRLFQYTRPYARQRNWLLVAVALRSLQMPALAWALGAVINGPIAGSDVHGMMGGAAGYLALAAVTALTLHYRQRLALELGEAVVHDLRRDLFRQYLRMPMSYYDRTKLGRFISRLTTDVEAMRAGVQNVLFVSLVTFGQGCVAAVLMAWYDAVLFGLVLAVAPAVWLINRFFRRRLSTAHRALQESWSRVTSTVAESVGGIRVTQGFVRQKINAGFFSELVTDHSKYNLGVARTSGVFLPLLELNTQFFTAAMIVLGGYRVLSPAHQIPAGTLVQFFFLANLFFEPFRAIGNQYNNALTAMAGAERVFKLLDTPPDWEDAPDAEDLGRITPATATGAHVEFRQVSFRYVPDRPALHEVSFVAEPGQTVALVGETGSGKSSVINLLSKFYLPTAGTVLLDGRDLRRITSDSLHRQLGMVTQQNFLFTGTLLENIRVGRPAATEEDVVAAIRQLGFLDLIGALPAGLATRVGERGVGLSVGQRQLICFARAFIANPRILILDEATSAVDAVTEARIQESLAKLLHGRTSFVVAHRLSTIRQADLLLVLDHGRIVERGTHEQLVTAGGVYAGLHRQFLRAGDAPVQD